jgi:murein DD-endopeptidase MepM/ murein hydrolase activator NlpD
MNTKHWRKAILVIAATAMGAVPALAAPDTTITAGPSGVVTETDATFEFTGGPGTAGFGCSLDGAKFEVCTSPTSYSQLPLGVHEFQVQAFDTSGVDETPASRQWTIIIDEPVPADLDPCPGTPSTADATPQGCSAAEVVTQAPAVMTPASDAVEASLKSAEGEGAPAGLKYPLEQVAQHLGKAKSALAQGDPCKASMDMADVEHALGKAEAVIEEWRVQREQAAAKVIGDDFSDEDLAVVLAIGAQNTMQGHFSMVREAGELISSSCNAITARSSVSGLITDIDNARRTITLDDGLVFGYVPATQKHPVFEGMVIDGVKVSFADGSSLLDKIGAKMPVGTGPKVSACLAPRIAPAAQLLPPFGSGPYTLHPIGGYLREGVLQLEQGMGIALADDGCPTTIPGVGSAGYHYEYFSNVSVDGDMIAGGAQDDDVPIVIQSPQIQLDTHEAMKFYVYRGECANVGVSCRNYVQLRVDTYPFVMRERGYYTGYFGGLQWINEANYDQIAFSVSDDDEDGDFEAARVDTGGFRPLVASDTPSAFRAEAYAIDGSGASSHPAVQTIGSNEPFAVYEDDFASFGLPAFPLAWPYGDTAEIAYRKRGQELPGALRWARVEGTQGGKPYAYSINLPRIQRDLVTDCLGTTDSYYKLPFHRTLMVGQGNWDDPAGVSSHSINRYAWDFPMPEGTDLFASRGGVVFGVEENDPWNSNERPADWSGPTTGNWVAITLSDGDVAIYNHLKAGDGVAVDPGQYVPRGGFIGRAGDTGSSTLNGWHLHYEVMRQQSDSADPNPFGWAGTRTKFEVFSFDTNQIETCVVPRQGDVVRSTLP